MYHVHIFKIQYCKWSRTINNPFVHGNKLIRHLYTNNLLLSFIEIVFEHLKSLEYKTKNIYSLVTLHCRTAWRLCESLMDKGRQNRREAWFDTHRHQWITATLILLSTRLFICGEQKQQPTKQKMLTEMFAELMKLRILDH